MTGGAVDRRDRAGALVGVLALLAVAGVLGVGVPEHVGERVVLPIVLAALALAVGLSRRRLRLLTTTVAAGIAAGLVLGACLRLAMLVAALMGGEVSRSVSGTVGLVLFAAIPSAVISGFVALLRRLRPVPPMVMGGLTLLLGGLGLLLPAGTRAELASEGVLAVNAITFLGSLALYGWLLVRLQERIERWWDQRAARRGTPAPPAPAAEAVPA